MIERAAKPAKNHAAVWQAIQDRLAPAVVAAGYAAHSAFRPVLDTQQHRYDCAFLAPIAPDGLRLIRMGYGQEDACWDVTGAFYASDRAAGVVRNLGPDRAAWTKALKHLPRRDTVLIPKPGWEFWRGASRHIDFDRQSGQPLHLDRAVDDALRGLPVFLQHLERPGIPGLGLLF